VLWVAAAQSHIGGWLASAADDHVRGDAGDADAVARAQAEIARRFAQLPNGEMVTVEDAGHMLHHDQPEIVARHLETFLEP
jgi:pimeloyl-ACP methyl ester carboxylesterase